ncbi:hypothetical protein C7N43_07915 [Sphingobacteriales bacterium UPWRP_1]|nr:hypothetical protein B6N25_11435 [Sphingobacteriales bacterium TSM_CSS]PSJ77581.1 hypothetical protein C7N43_07915 [Sphingobacteriales bacterium UPWRP_1]
MTQIAVLPAINPIHFITRKGINCNNAPFSALRSNGCLTDFFLIRAMKKQYSPISDYIWPKLA